MIAHLKEDKSLNTLDKVNGNLLLKQSLLTADDQMTLLPLCMACFKRGRISHIIRSLTLYTRTIQQYRNLQGLLAHEKMRDSAKKCLKR